VQNTIAFVRGSLGQRLLQQRINLEGKKREEAIEQLTNFMTDAIKTVSNRMEESWFCISGTLSMLPTTLQHSGAEWFCYWIFWPKD
jgi:hypothetical protein